MSLIVDISGLDDLEYHVQCRWQRVTKYVYCLKLLFWQNLPQKSVRIENGYIADIIGKVKSNVDKILIGCLV